MDKIRHKPRIYALLVDDDPTFCKIVETAAEEMDISILSCQSLSEMRNVALSGVFDVAIIDYYLDGARSNLKGLAIAQHLRKTPTILISQSLESEVDPEPWPNSIKKFICKRKGAKEILKAAIESHRKERNHRHAEVADGRPGTVNNAGRIF